MADAGEVSQAVPRGAGLVGGRVERVFSAAGKMHDDLRNSTSNGMLKHSLIAAFNTE